MDWNAFITSRGAVFADGQPVSFGGAEAELAAATGNIITDLSHMGLIAFAGEETETFLQGQLTNDVRQLTPGVAQYSGHCTPKGRLLANFLLWRQGDETLMQLPAALQPTIQKRLSMFILRAKVKPRDARAEFVRIGLAGPDAAALARQHAGAWPDADLGNAAATGRVIRLAPNRAEIIVAPAQAPALWDALAASARPVGYPVWQWLEVRAGVPSILPATQEQFVPQMVNYELVGGVSFQKGCYPGQEIVARTQYLGRLKRRMYLAHVNGATPKPGDELFTPDLDGQAAGMVVNSQPAPAGGYDLLAVIQMGSAEAQPVHLGSPDGTTLLIEPLPYPIGTSG